MKRDSVGCVQRTPTSCARQVAVAAMLLGALLLAGCAAGRSVRSTLGGWVDRVSGKETHEPRVSYAAVDRVKLYRDPDLNSPVLGVLGFHEKLLRDRDEGGFAHVEAAGNLSGWVPESQLIERLPRARRPAPKAPAPEAAQTPTEPAAPIDSAEPESETPSEVDEPSETTTPDPDAEALEPERSIFDPY